MLSIGMADTKDMNKIYTIRAIQIAEGGNVCFASPAVKTCAQISCLWREDCEHAIVSPTCTDSSST
jgi:hypothetical protein